MQSDEAEFDGLNTNRKLKYETGLNVNQITMMQEDATLEESSWYGDKEQYVCA